MPRLVPPSRDWREHRGGEQFAVTTQRTALVETLSDTPMSPSMGTTMICSAAISSTPSASTGNSSRGLPPPESVTSGYSLRHTSVVGSVRSLTGEDD
jgi:hypothetical protein